MPTQVARYIFGMGPTGSDFLDWGELRWDEGTGRITGVNALAERPHESAALDEASHLAVLPAFCNAHTHLDLGVQPPISLQAGENMVDWLLRVVRENRRNEAAPPPQEAVKQSLKAMMKAGTGVVADITQHPETAKTLVEAGFCGTLALEFFHPGVHPSPAFITTLAERYQYLKHMADGLFGLRVGLSPHSFYNVSRPALEAVVEALSPEFLHLHFGEFADETAYLQGVSPNAIERLHSSLLGQRFQTTHADEDAYTALLNFLTEMPPTLLAHGLTLSPRHIQHIMDTPTLHLVTCPQSNQHLHGEILNAEAVQKLAQTQRLLLGTDSSLSAASLDVRSDLQRLISVGHLNATPWEQLSLLTRSPAQALGFANCLGTLETGKLAQFSVWRLDEDETEFAAETILGHLLSPEQYPHCAAICLRGDLRAL